jgi:F0F1-type ATP synthase membrane subunit b/b'
MSKESNHSEQSIEKLQSRYTDLNTRKIQAETNLKNAQKQLEQFRQQAVKDYGTDDVDELRKQLDELKSENERKREEYQKSLDEIEQNLKKVDEDYAASASDSSSEDDSE